MTSYAFIYRNVVLAATAQFDDAHRDWKAEAVFRSRSGSLVICDAPRHGRSAAEALELAQDVAMRRIDDQIGASDPRCP